MPKSESRMALFQFRKGSRPVLVLVVVTILVFFLFGYGGSKNKVDYETEDYQSNQIYVENVEKGVDYDDKNTDDYYKKRVAMRNTNFDAKVDIDLEVDVEDDVKKNDNFNNEIEDHVKTIDELNIEEINDDVKTETLIVEEAKYDSKKHRSNVEEINYPVKKDLREKTADETLEDKKPVNFSIRDVSKHFEQTRADQNVQNADTLTTLNKVKERTERTDAEFIPFSKKRDFNNKQKDNEAVYESEDESDYDYETEDDNGGQYGNEEVRRKRYPTVLIIGSQKSGTTALFQYMRQHSLIKGPIPELHYFDKDADGENYHRYLKKMPRSLANQTTVEKTPNYFTVPKVPKLVLDYQKFINKTLKFILIVRNPIRRSISHAYHSERHHRVKIHNLTMTILYETTIHVESSLYGKHFDRWLQYFPRKQFLVLDGEKFAKENPAFALKQIEDFIGIPNQLTEQKFAYRDKMGFYCSKPVPYCLSYHKGHASYPQNLTQQGVKKLTDLFSHDLKTFWDLVGEKFDWKLD